MKNTHSSSKRLESLDALRGFDLFFLVALGPLMHSLARTANVEWLNESMWVFSHVSWEGFSPWDLIMPLFLFMSGISMPFSLSRYKSISDKRPLLRRLAKRILLLWIFGMMCQGNLLALDPNTIYLYSNTLQAIATGYLITALLFLFTSRRTQIITAVVLLLVYWTTMQFITVDGYGGGNYTPQGNLAEWIDNTVLGRFRDTAQVIDGKVVIADWYHYTWILSSLNFGVTVLTGLFAGYIAKDKIEEKKNTNVPEKQEIKANEKDKTKTEQVDKNSKTDKKEQVEKKSNDELKKQGSNIKDMKKQVIKKKQQEEEDEFE